MLAIDTTPALLHTGRPDGYLDYFNRRWLEYLGLSLEDICGCLSSRSRRAPLLPNCRTFVANEARRYCNRALLEIWKEEAFRK
jgi:hypothetical protein